MTYDGFMITGGKDGTCRVWVVDYPDMAVAIADGYVQTALGSQRESEKLLSCCHVLWGHVTPVFCVDIISDLDVAVSGSQGGVVCVHRIRGGEFVRSFSPPALDQESSRCNSVVKLALTTSGDMAVHMTDRGLHTFTINGVLLCSANAGESLNDMKISPCKDLLITGGSSGKVLVRRLSDLQVCSIMDLSKHGPIRSITLTPEELNPVAQFLFIGSHDGSITVVDHDPNSQHVTEE
jgi:WD40 repeat protein